jgi:hypothetical protein
MNTCLRMGSLRSAVRRVRTSPIPLPPSWEGGKSYMWMISAQSAEIIHLKGKN